MIQAFVNADIFTGYTVETDKALLVKNGIFIELASHHNLPENIDIIDVRGASLIPGFVDLQANGGGGILLNDDAGVEALKTVLDAHSRCGTTNLFPTVFTTKVDRMRELMSSALKLKQAGDSRISGLHFEGPIINLSKAGVHNKNNITEADEEIIELYIECAEKIPTVVTLAPEMIDPSVIRKLSQAGVLLFAGHTQATFEQMTTAIESGVKGVTHLYNACSGPSNREPGAVGYAMVDDSSYFSIIADGFHVHFASINAALRCKPAGKAFLITDSMPPLGTDQSHFFIDDLEVFVRDGRCQTADGTLAGSALDMVTAIRNCIQKVGINRAEAIRMATTYPANFAKIGEGIGCIKVGAPANFVICDNEMHISSVYVSGKKVT